MDKITGEWRKLHNAELHQLYNSPDIINVIKSRRLKWAGHAARMDEDRTAYKILIFKPDGKRPLGRPRSRWEDNIRMDLNEMGYEGSQMEGSCSGTGTVAGFDICGNELSSSQCLIIIIII